jgi:WD40 repeat protein
MWHGDSQKDPTKSLYGPQIPWGSYTSGPTPTDLSNGSKPLQDMRQASHNSRWQTMGSGVVSKTSRNIAESLASMDKNVRFHPFDNLEPTTVTHPCYVNSIAMWSTNNRDFVLSGGDDGDVRVFDITEMDQWATNQQAPSSVVIGHSSAVTSLHVLDDPDANDWVLITSSLDSTIRRWTKEGKSPMK